jgi:hypothetical protein
MLKGSSFLRSDIDTTNFCEMGKSLSHRFEILVRKTAAEAV